VAEGAEEAEKYRAQLLKTAPRVMDFLAKAVKGWRPSEQEMLGAIDTAYTVMKHTGDVKQAGKAMVDELNTLHRMSQGQSGITEGWSQKYKRSINCSHPKGFSQKAHCAGKKKHNESIETEMVCEDCGMCETHGDHSQDNLAEACWKGYHKEGMKTMFGKRYPNCVKNTNEELEEDLRKWFKEKWVRFGPDGKIRGDCARGDDSEGKPKCLPQSKAQNLGKKGRASAAARKRRQDPNPERSGKAINVNTKKKTDEAVLDEKWSQKYKSSINCASPKGFSQRAHCAGKKKNESVAEASGYIPVNNKEAQDPRYAMAITVDIKPGEIQRQAAKMGFKTDAAGVPPLLMKLQNQLKEIKAGTAR